MYSELNYHYEPLEGGCESWNYFLKGRDFVQTLTVKAIKSVNIITIKQLYDYYETIDRRPETLACNESNIADSIVRKFDGHQNSSFQVICNNNIWKIKTCGQNRSSFCVNCDDPCSVHCSNERTVRFISPCLSSAQKVCYDLDRHRRYGIINSIHILTVIYDEIDFPPSLTFLSVISGRTSLVITANLSSTGLVRCGVFESESRYSVSLTDIDVQGYSIYVNASDNSIFEIKIDSLRPATNYSLFCYGTSASGSRQRLEDILSKEVKFRTGCCRSLTATLSHLSYIEGQVYDKFLSIVIPDVVHGVNISLSLISSSGQVVNCQNQLIPSSFITTSQTAYLVALSTLSSSKIVLGLYNISISLIGMDAKNYLVTILPVNRISILSVGSVLPAPSILSSIYSKTGNTIIVQFDQRTDRAGLSTIFNCSKLLIFPESLRSQCTWRDESTLWIFPPSPSIVESTLINSYEGLVAYNHQFERNSSLSLVGAGLSVRSGSLKAVCVTTLQDCSTWPFSTTSSTIGIPEDAETPLLQIIAPSILGKCDDLQIDLTASTGFGSYPWFNVTLSVSSLTAPPSSIQLVKSFIATKYIINPPAAIPRSYFTPDNQYSFFFHACNFLRKCSTTSIVVAVLNESSPYVTIQGAPIQRIRRSQSLILNANANITRGFCTSLPTKSNLQYFWNVYIRNVKSSILKSTSVDPTTFVLPPYSLEINTVYEVRVRVADALSRISSIFSVKVIPELDPFLTYTTDLKSELTVYFNTSATLSASSTLSADPLYFSQVKYYWRCIQLLPTLSLECPFSNFINVEASRSNILVLSGNLINSTSLVILSALGPQNISSEYRVRIKIMEPEGLPIQLLTSIDNHYTVTTNNDLSIDTSEKLKIRALFNTSSSGLSKYPKFMLRWSMQGDSTEKYLSSIALTPIKIDIREQQQSQRFLGVDYFATEANLVLRPNSLASGGRYTFVATVGGISSSLQIYVNEAPSPGNFLASPRQGIEMSTIFTLVLTSWTDSDLPLRYGFGYYDIQGRMIRSRYPVVVSYAYMMFPCLAMGEANATTNIYGEVLDHLNAGSTVAGQIMLKRNESFKDALNANFFEAALSTFSGNKDSMTSAISILNEALKVVDCRKAPNCKKLNRKECSTVSNTCGSCFSGYIGASSSANTLCVPKPLGGSSNSNNFESSGQNRNLFESQTCRINLECESWELCINRKCSAIQKNCSESSDCSHHGQCIYFNVNTGNRVKTCSIVNPLCEAKCICDVNYAGSMCQYDSDSFQRRVAARSYLISSYANQTQGLNVNSNRDLLRIMAQSISLLQDDELDVSSVPSLLQLCIHVLNSSANMGTSSTDLSQFVRIFDSFAATRVNILLNSTKYLELMQFFGDILANDMVVGEADIILLQSHLKMMVKVLPSTYNRTSIGPIGVPLTELENSMKFLPSSITLPQFSVSVGFNIGGTSQSSTLPSINVVSLEIPSRVFPGDNLISNPLLVKMKASGSHYLSLNCSDRQNGANELYETLLTGEDDCEMEIVLQYNQKVHIIPPYEDVTQTQCYDRDYYIMNYTCLTNNLNISEPCPGVPGVIFDRCPIVNVTTVCAKYANDSGFGFSSCIAREFNEVNVTCVCKFGSDVITDLSLEIPDSLSSSTIRRLVSVNESIIFQNYNYSSASLLYGARQRTFTTGFDKFFEEGGGLIADESRIVLMSMSIFAGLVLIVSFISYNRDYYDSRVFYDKVMHKKKKKARAKEEAVRQKKKLFRIASVDSDDGFTGGKSSRQVYPIDEDIENEDDRMDTFLNVDDDQDTNEPSDYKLPNISKIVKSKVDPTIQDLDRISYQVLSKAVPAIYDRYRSYFMKIKDEIICYHRWLNIITHRNANYTRFLRGCALASQVLSPIFFMAISFAYLNPDDGSCSKYLDGRSCISEVSALIPDKTKCFWTYSDHKCNFRQPIVPNEVLIFVTLLSATLSIPLVKSFEYWVLIKFCIPASAYEPTKTNSETSSAGATSDNQGIPADRIKSWLKWWRSSTSNPSRVVPIRSISASNLSSSSLNPAPHQDFTFDDEDDDPYIDNADREREAYIDTPDALAKLHHRNHHLASIQSKFSFNSVGKRQTINVNRYKTISFIKSSSVDTELELIQGRIKRFCDSLTYLGNQKHRFDVAGAWGLDTSNSSFLRSSLNILNTKWHEFDDRADIVLRQALIYCREQACDELETLAYAPLTDEFEQSKRLIYLWQRDFLGSDLATMIFEMKTIRDSFQKEWEDYQSYQFRFAGSPYVSSDKQLTITFFAIFVMAGMVVYIFLFAFSQPTAIQTAWLSSFFIWIGLDLFLIASLEVQLLHVWIPCLIYSDVKAVQDHILSFVDRSREKILSDQANPGIGSNAMAVFRSLISRDTPDTPFDMLISTPQPQGGPETEEHFSAPLNLQRPMPPQVQSEVPSSEAMVTMNPGPVLSLKPPLQLDMSFMNKTSTPSSRKVDFDITKTVAKFKVKNIKVLDGEEERRREVSINSAEFFSVAYRVAQYFGEGTACKVILSYSSTFPPGHEVLSLTAPLGTSRYSPVDYKPDPDDIEETKANFFNDQATYVFSYSYYLLKWWIRPLNAALARATYLDQEKKSQEFLSGGPEPSLENFPPPMLSNASSTMTSRQQSKVITMADENQRFESVFGPKFGVYFQQQFLRWFLLRPYFVQDMIAQLVITLALALLLWIEWLLYLVSPYLAAVPVVAVSGLFAIFIIYKFSVLVMLFVNRYRTKKSEECKEVEFNHDGDSDDEIAGENDLFGVTSQPSDSRASASKTIFEIADPHRVNRMRTDDVMDFLSDDDHSLSVDDHQGKYKESQKSSFGSVGVSKISSIVRSKSKIGELMKRGVSWQMEDIESDNGMQVMANFDSDLAENRSDYSKESYDASLKKQDDFSDSSVDSSSTDNDSNNKRSTFIVRTGRSPLKKSMPPSQSQSPSIDVSSFGSPMRLYNGIPRSKNS